MSGGEKLFAIHKAPRANLRGFYIPRWFRINLIPQKTKRAFTLIELLVVIAVVAILASILFPVFASARNKANQAKCLSNLKQIAAAWMLYSEDYNGRACPSYYWHNGNLYSWDVSFVKSVRKVGLLGPYTKTEALNGCPSFKGNGWDRAYTGYAYNATYIGGDCVREGSSSTFIRQPCLIAEISKPAHTVVFADAGFGNPVSACNYLRAPSDRTSGTFRNGTLHFRHGGFANVAYADGSVRSTNAICRYKPSYAPECGTLSEDDSAYDLN